MWDPEAGEKGDGFKNSWMGRLFPLFTTIAKTRGLIARGGLYLQGDCLCVEFYFCFKLTTRARRLTTVTFLNSPHRPVRFRSEIAVLKVQKSVCLSSNLTKALVSARARHMDQVCSQLPSSRAASRTSHRA